MSELRAVLGEDDVLEEPIELHIFSKDASLMRGQPTCVTFPTSVEEVAEIVRIAERHRVPIVARGAGTGLAAGASPTEGGIVVVTTALNSIEIDPENRTAWVGAGVINLDLSHAAQPFGLYFAPDPSSQSACTIGGNVANNSVALTVSQKVRPPPTFWVSKWFSPGVRWPSWGAPHRTHPAWTSRVPWSDRKERSPGSSASC